jgi:hypothetical protein
VHLEFTDALSMNELTGYPMGSNVAATYTDQFPMIQAFNILLKHYAKEAGSLVSIGASKTFSLGTDAAKFDLGRGLDAIRGFFSSVRAATGRVLVNVNVSHAAFYQAGPLDGLMTAFQTGNKYALEKFLKGVRIQSTHLKEKRNRRGELIPRIKTIRGLASPIDGRHLNHPPQVSVYGAGPKHVSFWLESQGHSQPAIQQAEGGKGGKKKNTSDKEPATGSPPSTLGAYITVYEFFSRSELKTFVTYKALYHFGTNMTAEQHMGCSSSVLTSPSSTLAPKTRPRISRPKSASCCQARLPKQS